MNYLDEHNEEPTNASYYRREMKKMEAELTSLRSFRKAVMELEPVGVTYNEGTSFTVTLPNKTKLYDLKGIKDANR